MTLRQNERQHEKNQLIITELLKDDENKYCADCDAKAPRWASWNLGILLCIRCAGIHRGLGVHISKVKSLNLDSWEPHQIAMLREVGNRKGRIIYEANLPEYFRRPQSDSAVEQFIRAKYEQKRYIIADFVPPQPDVDAVRKELARLEQQQHQKRRPTHPKSLILPSKLSDGRNLKSVAANASVSEAETTLSVRSHPLSTSPKPGPSHVCDLLSISHSSQSSVIVPAGEYLKDSTSNVDLLGLQLGPLPTTATSKVEDCFSCNAVCDPQRSTKESILALYAQSSQLATFTGFTALSHPTNGAPQMITPTLNVTGSTALLDLSQPVAGKTSTLNTSVGGFYNHFTGNQFETPVTKSLPHEMSNSEWASTTSGGNASLSQWPPVSVNSTKVMSSSGVPRSPMTAQQDYLVQIQNQLASLQVQGSVRE